MRTTITALALTLLPLATHASEPHNTLQLNHHTVQTPAVQSRHLRTTVELTLDQPATIELTPFDVRSPDFRAVLTDADGVDTHLDTRHVLTYRGTILGQPGSSVAATIYNNRLHLYAIEADGDTWIAEPLPAENHDDNPRRCAVYKTHDVIPIPGACDVEAPHHHNTTTTTRGGNQPRGIPECPDHEATIELTGDTAFFILEGEDAAPRLIAIMNNVDMLYRDNLSLAWSLRGVQIFTNGDPWGPPTVISNEIDPGDLLADFSSWVTAQAPVTNDRDVAHLATGFNLVGTVIGRAGLNTLCTSTPATGIDQFTHNDAIDTSLIAHECGHNWGAIHDGTMDNQCPTSGFVMGAFNSGSTTFSTCSINEIAPALERICVRQLPGAVELFAAVDDEFVALRGTPRILDVLANELLCVDGVPTSPGTITVPATSDMGNPIEVISPPGLDREVILYSPNPVFTGLDTIDYTLTGPVDSTTANVSILVNIELEPQICDAGFGRYQADNGSPLAAAGLPPGTPFMWMKQFTVQPGGEQIGAIEVAVGTFATGSIGVWSDPNNDGNPADAILIASLAPVDFAPGLITQFPFPITNIGNAGDSFFIGAGGTTSPGDSPLAVDGAPHAGRNFVVVAPFGDVPTGNPQIEGMLGNFLIRAIGGTLDDCNNNGLIDRCEILNIEQHDANNDGIPDTCQEPPCPCEFDDDNSRVSVADLLVYLEAWFAQTPTADIDQTPGVTILDLLTFLECWIPASVNGNCN